MQGFMKGKCEGWLKGKGKDEVRRKGKGKKTGHAEKNGEIGKNSNTSLVENPETNFCGPESNEDRRAESNLRQAQLLMAIKEMLDLSEVQIDPDESAQLATLIQKFKLQTEVEATDVGRDLHTLAAPYGGGCDQPNGLTRLLTLVIDEFKLRCKLAHECKLKNDADWEKMQTENAQLRARLNDNAESVPAGTLSNTGEFGESGNQDAVMAKLANELMPRLITMASEAVYRILELKMVPHVINQVRSAIEQVLYEDQDDDDSEEPNSEEEEEDDEVPTSEDERSSAGSEKEIKLTAGKTNGQLATKDLGAPPEKTLSSSSLDNCSCKEKEKSKVTDYLEAQRDFVANNGVFEHNGSYAIPGAGSPSPKWASAKGDSPEMDTSPWINPAAAAQSSKDSDDADMSSKGTTSKGRLVLKNEGWKMVIVARQDLGMSAGKIGAQVGHAVHTCVRKSRKNFVKTWEKQGSMKVVLGANSEAELREIRKAAKNFGLTACKIRDAGHTEIEENTMTVVGIGPATDQQINCVTGNLKLFKDPVAALETKLAKMEKKAKNAEDELQKARAVVKMLRADRLSLVNNYSQIPRLLNGGEFEKNGKGAGKRGAGKKEGLDVDKKNGDKEKSQSNKKNGPQKEGEKKEKKKNGGANSEKGPAGASRTTQGGAERNANSAERKGSKKGGNNNKGNGKHARNGLSPAERQAIRDAEALFK